MEDIDYLLQHPLLIPLALLPVVFWMIERHGHRSARSWIVTFGVPLGGRFHVVEGTPSMKAISRLLGRSARSRVLDKRRAIVQAREDDDHKSISYAIVSVQPIPGATRLQLRSRAKLSPFVFSLALSASAVVIGGGGMDGIILGAAVGTVGVLVGTVLGSLKIRDERKVIDEAWSAMVEALAKKPASDAAKTAE